MMMTMLPSGAPDASDAVRPAPSPQEIADGLRQFSGEEVELWHFAMMNDTARNAAYEAALGNALRKGGTVLDIGTGSGLLAMMAVRQGADRVIACEAIPSIARKATEIIRKNGYADRIQVIHKKSTQLIVGQDLPERADVLVTEIFDDGLLGEGAFAAIGHAKRELLKPEARVLPVGARLIAMVIESQELLENARVGQVSGFDLSPFNEFAPRNYIGYHLDKMAYRPLSAPKTVFAFDFRDYPGDRTVSFGIDALADGTAHAVAYWYELQVDESTMISTAPGLAKLSGWKQAVRLLSEPKALRRGQRLELKAHHDMDSAWFSG